MESRVFTVLAAVPPGTVVTYGQVAKLAGLPNGARQVGRIPVSYTHLTLPMKA